ADWIDAHGNGAKPEALRAEVEALARAVEPEPAGPATTDVERFRPFPVGALPEPVRGVVAAGAGAVGGDPSDLGLPLLFVLSPPSTVYETPTTHVEDRGFVDVDSVDAAASTPADDSTDFPFGLNNPDDPDGMRLFSESRGLPD